MDIQNEIIEVSNQMIYTLNESGFFEESPFLDEDTLKKVLQSKMIEKIQKGEDYILDEQEFLNAINETISQTVSNTLTDLVEKGAVNMGVDETGEIVYSANKDFNTDEL